LAVELVPNLHADFALTANASAEGIELVILVGDDAAVVRMDLLVVEVCVVGGRVYGIIAVGEEGRAVCDIVVIVFVGRGVVGKSDGFGGVLGQAWCLLGGGEVGGEGGMIWCFERG